MHLAKYTKHAKMSEKVMSRQKKYKKTTIVPVVK